MTPEALRAALEEAIKEHMRLVGECHTMGFRYGFGVGRNHSDVEKREASKKCDAAIAAVDASARRLAALAALAAAPEPLQKRQGLDHLAVAAKEGSSTDEIHALRSAFLQWAKDFGLEFSTYTSGPCEFTDDPIAWDAFQAGAAAAAPVGQEAAAAWIEDGKKIARAVSVMDDVLGDIADWEDRALSEAVTESRNGLLSVLMRDVPAAPTVQPPSAEQLRAIHMAGDWRVTAEDFFKIARAVLAAAPLADVQPVRPLSDEHIDALRRVWIEGAAEDDANNFASAVEAAHGFAPDAQPVQDFDAWQANPYTKVLQKSIAEDYVPRDRASPQVVAAQEPGAYTRGYDAGMAIMMDRLNHALAERGAVAVLPAELPPLPAQADYALFEGRAMQGSEIRNLSHDYEPNCAQYTAEQMRAYALAARAAVLSPSNSGLVNLNVASNAGSSTPTTSGLADSAPDVGCICKGNWRAIVSESETLFDKRFRDWNGDEFTFYGVVHGSDDYYYGMSGKAGLRLLSCVGSIEGHGYAPVEAGAPPQQLPSDSDDEFRKRAAKARSTEDIK